MIKIEMMDTDKGYSLAVTAMPTTHRRDKTSYVRQFLCWRRRWQTRWTRLQGVGDS